MTTLAFVLILASVVFHAAWNVLSKSQSPSCPFFVLVSLSVIVVSAPFLLLSGVDFGALPGTFWLHATFAGFCGALCNSGLSYSYRMADASLAYPLSRALPVLLTPLATAVLGIGQPLPVGAIMGMVTLSLGCFIMPFDSFAHPFRNGNGILKVMPFVLLSALGVTGYSICDSESLRIMQAYGNQKNTVFCSLAYSCIREANLGAFILAYSLINPHERALWHWGIFKKSQPYTAGMLALIAYTLVLIAMRYVTNVSYVQAFRMMSLPIGMLFGIIFLKERSTATRWVGVSLLLVGLLICKLH